MSSILKALKKMERERATRLDLPLELGRDILLGEARRSRRAVWLWPVLVGVLLLGLIFGGWQLLQPRPPLPVTVSAAPVPPEMTILAASRQDEVVVEELVERRRPASVGPLLPQPKGQTGTAGSADAASVPTAKTPEQPHPKPVSETPPPPVAVMPSPPAAELILPLPDDEHLTIQAIAFSSSREERLAVVNELPVMEGTTIGSFLVDEILADRVIFSRDGQRFVVPFTVH